MTINGLKTTPKDLVLHLQGLGKTVSISLLEKYLYTQFLRGVAADGDRITSKDGVRSYSEYIRTFMQKDPEVTMGRMRKFLRYFLCANIDAAHEQHVQSIMDEIRGRPREATRGRPREPGYPLSRVFGHIRLSRSRFFYIGSGVREYKMRALVEHDASFKNWMRYSSWTVCSYCGYHRFQMIIISNTIG